MKKTIEIAPENGAKKSKPEEPERSNGKKYQNCEVLPIMPKIPNGMALVSQSEFENLQTVFSLFSVLVALLALIGFLVVLRTAKRTFQFL